MSMYLFEPASRPALDVAGSERLFPVHRIYCVGQNYAAHAREMGEKERKPPFFFTKPADAVIRAASVPFPPATDNLHHEVELVVAIGSGGRDIAESSALESVFGYAVGVDLTRRDLQAHAKERSQPWDVAKGFDHSAPISAITPAQVCGHPSRGRIRLAVDGDTRQQGDLSDMIWPVPSIIAELSRYFTLEAGDLVFTGTPEGVGRLLPGQRVECDIEGVGAHRFELGDGG